jgi:hypothetical protein
VAAQLLPGEMKAKGEAPSEMEFPYSHCAERRRKEPADRRRRRNGKGRKPEDSIPILIPHREETLSSSLEERRLEISIQNCGIGMDFVRGFSYLKEEKKRGELPLKWKFHKYVL